MWEYQGLVAVTAVTASPHHQGKKAKGKAGGAAAGAAGGAGGLAALLGGAAGAGAGAGAGANAAGGESRNPISFPSFWWRIIEKRKVK